MKHTLLLGAMIMGVTGLFCACTDDNDSNPVLQQPTAFVLNTPPTTSNIVLLENTEAMPLTWSQPDYTAVGAPVNAAYEVQLSTTGSFEVSDIEAADNDELVADYITLSKIYTECRADIQCEELNKLLLATYGWTADNIPADITLYARVNAYIPEGSKRLYPITSNTVTLRVAPYFMLLTDAEPIMWYMLGNNFGDNGWSNKASAIGVSNFPMLLDAECAYDKNTGAGTLKYMNYFTTSGWKILPDTYNWDYGFMNNKEGDVSQPNSAVYRDGKSDNGDIWCDTEGIYLVTLNTADNTCTIVKQDITPTVYSQVCMAGSFNGWGDTNMTPVNTLGENHVWCYEMTVDENVVEEVKFKILGSWDTNWGYGASNGEVNTCGKCTNNGSNIGVPAGHWVIMFCDITGEFSIIPKL